MPILAILVLLWLPVIYMFAIRHVFSPEDL